MRARTDKADRAVADIYTARSLADTLQAVADGAVAGLGFELAAVNLVRPDGDLVVAAFAGNPAAEALLTGRVGSRASWERRLHMGEDWAGLRFIPHTEGWVLSDDDVPQWKTEGPLPGSEDGWHPEDRLYAPMYASGIGGELLGVISVDRPSDGRRPDTDIRADLRAYAYHGAIAISNARLRSNMQRALVRLEREQQALRASEESFRQAFEYAPSGIAIAELGGDQHGRFLRVNDALCRLLGRPSSAMRRYQLADLVHAEDIGTLLRTSAEGGRAELRLGRRDGTYVWVSLRNSVIADTTDGPRFLLTHVEDIDQRKRYEFGLLQRACTDELTNLLTESEVRVQLGRQLCLRPDTAAEALAHSSPEPGGDLAGRPSGAHQHVELPSQAATTLAVVHLGLDEFRPYNTRYGRAAGDAALRECANVLRAELRAWGRESALGRVRGDEFVVLAPQADEAEAAALVTRLRTACRRQFADTADLGKGPLGMTGVVYWATCGRTPEQVLRHSGDLLHAMKLSR
ncbi:diguanylate cyclase domain-containing protein [Streptomyces sp. NPDC056632]|uniref:diguanylate cyclase domain-containing protein n=1 Tax=Streptomyces sp. NPDC056632 TaxID=3345884 RepID=UPI00369D274F